MAKVNVSVEKSNYTSRYNGGEVLSVDLDGGAPRTRTDKLGAWAFASVQWTVGPDEFTYLMAFYRIYKAVEFTIDLILDSATPTTYTAKFVPDTFKLYSQSGMQYILTADLRVKPLPVDAVADAAIIASFS